jgi:hypothetical protein
VTPTTLAYLDPGSSSMILQMLLGGVAAVGVALKLYWRRFMRLLGLRKDVGDPAAERQEKLAAQRAEASANGSDTGGPAADADRSPVETTNR